jgi:hypothetical protein
MSIEDMMATANTDVTLASAKLKLQQSARPQGGSTGGDDDDSNVAIAEFQRMAPPSISFVADQPDSFRSNAFGSAPVSRTSSRSSVTAPVSSTPPSNSSFIAAPYRATSQPIAEVPNQTEKPRTTHVIPNQVGSSSGTTPKSVSSGRTWGK